MTVKANAIRNNLCYSVIDLVYSTVIVKLNYLTPGCAAIIKCDGALLSCNRGMFWVRTYSP